MFAKVCNEKVRSLPLAGLYQVSKVLMFLCMPFALAKTKITLVVGVTSDVINVHPIVLGAYVMY
jgi:hypothetical protein